MPVCVQKDDVCQTVALRVCIAPFTTFFLLRVTTCVILIWHVVLLSVRLSLGLWYCAEAIARITKNFPLSSMEGHHSSFLEPNVVKKDRTVRTGR